MAGTKIPMAELTQLYSEKDDISLPVIEEHVLWKNECFPNISSRAVWNQYQAVIDDPQLQHWCKKENGHTQSIIDCRSWKVFKEAIDRAYRYLTNEDVALERATVTLPVILRIGQNIKEKFARGAASLCIYIRIDFKTDAQVYLQSKERMEVEIECGTMFIVSGYQRHRLTGDGVVIAFHIDLPSISRSEALNKLDELQSDLNDESIFYSAVAQPISRPLPSFECIKEKIYWLDHRAYKRYRRFECPVIKKYLLENNISSAVIDSVDAFPESQVDVSPELLAQLVGKETCQAVLNLPKILDKSLLHGKSSRLGYSLFLRLYSQETRSLIPFHHDISDYTCVIALNDQSDFSGGDFIMLNGDNLEKAAWKQGEALLHSGNLIHGVSKMNAGKRYSLVMFADHVE